MDLEISPSSLPAHAPQRQLALAFVTMQTHCPWRGHQGLLGETQWTVPQPSQQPLWKLRDMGPQQQESLVCVGCTTADLFRALDL